MKFDVILAIDEKNWLWKNNSLAWHIPSELKYFKDITTKTIDLSKFNAVVMWKNTWLSLPEKSRPLPNRINCILDRDLKIDDYNNSSIDDFVLYYKSFEHCLADLKNKNNIENIFVIWWASVYNYVINNDNLDKIYITKVQWDYKCDVFFNWIPKNFILSSYSDEFEENNIKFIYEIYTKN